MSKITLQVLAEMSTTTFSGLSLYVIHDQLRAAHDRITALEEENERQKRQHGLRILRIEQTIDGEREADLADGVAEIKAARIRDDLERLRTQIRGHCFVLTSHSDHTGPSSDCLSQVHQAFTALEEENARLFDALCASAPYLTRGDSRSWALDVFQKVKAALLASSERLPQPTPDKEKKEP